ncbi:MAG: zinc ABC transporter substrate-binding protein, partial [Clostridia bacterium]|nr:zinc ABC transporter substrate-binding protein [Clostridia bacterium]
NSSKYAANAANYLSKLDALDEKYTQAVAEKSKDTLLFADRFPFLYLVKDYGLKYFAAFKGCSAASEASFNTMAFLSGKVDELSLSVILKLESSDGSIAQTVKNSTISKDQKILTLDSLQSSTIKEYEAGRNYLGVMEENLEVLKEALK